MVISAVKPEVEWGVDGLDESVEATTDPVVGVARSEVLVCPRCDARLMIGYDEPQCLQCGHADYTNMYAKAPKNERGVISTATRYVLRYVGDFSSLSDTITHVRLVRLRNRAVYAVKCPFCSSEMDQSSLSGKRPEVREQRYRCLDGHRVSLVPSGNGMLGWR